MHIGICGEHGGDPESIEFCQSIDLDYVSCSPFRVPIARLAAAQSAIKKMILDGIEKILKNHPVAKDVDELSVGVLDFSNGDSSKFIFESNGEKLSAKVGSSFYDLASLTKPLTVGLLQFLYPTLLKNLMLLFFFLIAQVFLLGGSYFLIMIGETNFILSNKRK